jgi:hypothetical protein
MKVNVEDPFHYSVCKTLDILRLFKIRASKIIHKITFPLHLYDFKTLSITSTQEMKFR